MKLSRFAKFTWFVLSWNLLVIVWGALVRATGSGAGCGNHWPSCNGEIIPTPERIQTVIEFTHRALSGIDLLLIFGMLIWGWRITKSGDHLRIGLVGSAVFIIVEAILGAGLVLFQVSESNSAIFQASAIAIHLFNTFILIGFLGMTAWWSSGGSPISLENLSRKWIVLFSIGLLGVLVIGITGSITALGDTLFPAKSLAEGLSQDVDPGASFLIRLRVIHPIIAILVGTYTLYLVEHIRRNFIQKPVRNLSLLLGGVIVVQWIAGITNLFLLAPIWMQLLHLFIADSVWISYILLTASIFGIQPQTV